MTPFPIPVVALGPGSHEDAEPLNYLPLPHDMRAYRPPVLPEPDRMPGRAGVRPVLDAVLRALTEAGPGRVARAVDLAGLDADALALLGQVLGEGEVSARVVTGNSAVPIQESVFAGVWRLRTQVGERWVADSLVVAEAPDELRAIADASPDLSQVEPGPDVASAPALLAEIAEQVRARVARHVINLSLLPFAPGDGEYLDRVLGRGPVSILSRGYGNCRVTATAVARVWWVQYFNVQDALILNTLEIADLPEVVLAAREDFEDSHERLAEVLDWIG